ncbi:hypothetical protein QJS66_15785 [Kocuria rhizophila]|nr:hypothetical protein QJS66_15785 [Kocuria rhizophila]
MSIGHFGVTEFVAELLPALARSDEARGLAPRPTPRAANGSRGRSRGPGRDEDAAVQLSQKVLGVSREGELACTPRPNAHCRVGSAAATPPAAGEGSRQRRWPPAWCSRP